MKKLMMILILTLCLALWGCSSSPTAVDDPGEAVTDTDSGDSGDGAGGGSGGGKKKPRVEP